MATSTRGTTVLRTVLSLCGVLVLSSLSSAVLVIDDFTVGDYHTVVEWPRNQDVHVREDLDRDHVAFGRRFGDLRIASNFDRVDVAIDFGDGRARVSYPSNNLGNELRIGWGGERGIYPSLDLSPYDEFWVDLATEDPPERIADSYRLTVVDTANNVLTNGNWLFRPGGIRFRKRDFGNVDWTQIQRMQFTHRYTTDFGTVPRAHEVSRVVAVPEPLVAPALIIGLLLGGKRSPPTSAGVKASGSRSLS
jgi:hypothetical protein